MVVIGTVAHELSHALVLRAIDVPHDIHWFPDKAEAGLGGGFGRWAAVVPRHLPTDLSPWALRLSALAPLALATPMALILVGALPDPLAAGSVPLYAATVGWIACAIPSPSDFSLVWYAEEVIEAGGPDALARA